MKLLLQLALVGPAAGAIAAFTVPPAWAPLVAGGLALAVGFTLLRRARRRWSAERRLGRV